MTTGQIAWSVLAGIALLELIIASLTGRAYYGFPFLFEERNKNPFGFWLAILASVAALVMGVTFGLGFGAPG